MSALPPNILHKKGGRWRDVSLLEIVVMLYHVHKGAEEEQVGFEDAQETIQTLTRRLNKRVYVDPALLESCLWSCNLMNEQGKFWHPRGLTFDEYVSKVLGSASEFNRVYNMIEKKEMTK